MYGVRLQPVIVAVGGYVTAGTAPHLKKTLKLASEKLSGSSSMARPTAFTMLWLRLCTGLASVQGHFLLRRAQALRSTASLPTPQPRNSMEMPAGWGGGDPTQALGRGSADLAADFTDLGVSRMHMKVPFCIKIGTAYNTSLQYTHGLLEEAQRLAHAQRRSDALAPPVIPLSAIIPPTAGVLAMIADIGSSAGASPVAKVSGKCAIAAIIATELGSDASSMAMEGLRTVAKAVDQSHQRQLGPQTDMSDMVVSSAQPVVPPAAQAAPQ